MTAHLNNLICKPGNVWEHCPFGLILGTNVDGPHSWLHEDLIDSYLCLQSAGLLLELCKCCISQLLVLGLLILVLLPFLLRGTLELGCCCALLGGAINGPHR
jgi:hypothetical protein